MTNTDWRRTDYEASCVLANKEMRLSLIRKGDILPNKDDPAEIDAHEAWKRGRGK